MNRNNANKNIHYLFECLNALRIIYVRTGFSNNSDMERAISIAPHLGLRPTYCRVKFSFHLFQFSAAAM